MNFRLHVDPEHFEYLRIQKGSLDQFAGDRLEWQKHYEADLAATFGQIEPFLPADCGEILDVGSGLGGIDVLLSRHYLARNREAPGVTLLDGLEDPPVMNLHRRTFSNARIARNFHWKNGTSLLRLATVGPDVQTFAQPFDLIVSFGSWCFHYPPAFYLGPVCTSGLKPSTVLVLDVRAEKPDWFGDLERALELVTMVAVKPKWSRCVFRVKPAIAAQLQK